MLLNNLPESDSMMDKKQREDLEMVGWGSLLMAATLDIWKSM